MRICCDRCIPVVDSGNRSRWRTTPIRGQAHGLFLVIPTRSIDNDVYGDVNDVVSCACSDNVINEYLIREGRLNIHHDQIVGLQ